MKKDISDENNLDEQKIVLSTKDILISLLDQVVEGINIFDSYHYYGDYVKNYRKWSSDSHYKISRQISNLKHLRLIEKFQEDKKMIIRLTPVGRKKAFKYLFKGYIPNLPKNWDKKWRIIIFDIPEDKKTLRDAIRFKLKQTGLYPLQKSVFVFPFDCQELVVSLKYGYDVGKNLQYIVADSIEGEVNLVDYFIKQDILKDYHILSENVQKS